MNIRLSLVAAVPLLCATAFPQAPGAHWSTTTTTTNPPLRRENPGTADFSNMYVFGGRSGGSGGVPMNDLWRFDGTAWTLMTADGAPGSPPQRDKAGVTWDFPRGKLVVFGGIDPAGTALGDTWEWDPMTNAWTDVTPGGLSPSARSFCSITSDPGTNKVLLFGGLDAGGTHLDDTWTFDGTTWTQLSPAAPLPPVRRQHHLVTRLDHGDVILCGGQDATLAGSAKWRVDTWRWDGTSWTEIMTANAPSAQVANDAAYDLIRGRIVLAGGNGTGGQPVGTIAEFDSRTNDWINRPLDPGIYKVSRYFAAYVASLGRTYKVSGQALNATTPPDLTYEFQSDILATFDASATATGCPSTTGAAPVIQAVGKPWAGTTTVIELSGLPAGTPAFMLLGFAPGTLNLAVIGAPLCTVHISGPLSFPMAGTGGVASMPIPLPANPALYGKTFYVQGAILGAAANPVGIALSARGDALIGAL